MKRIREWLAETHSADFELLRHFVVRFFDSDLVSSAGQWLPVLIGNLAMALPAFFMIVPALIRKYRRLSSLADPDLYRHAVRADELWLITLGMSIIGLLTAVKLPSLFPDLRDYLALGALPVRSRQIFVSKLLALMLLATGAILVINLFPGLTFPAISASQWQTNPSLLIHIAAHIVSCASACYFFFFALVAYQGVLLNLLPPGLFGRVTVYLQGALVTLMLVMMVLSFSIGPRFEEAVLSSEAGQWLPPVWFLGLYQRILGDSNPLFGSLARRAWIGLAATVAIALFSYLLSYRRHRELLMERPSSGNARRRWGPATLDRVMPDPRQQAVWVFMANTLMRSGVHRVLLMGYLGLALALTLTGIIGIANLVKDDRKLLDSFVYAHLVLLLILLLGLKHMFAIPSEWRANWMFQITEREGRREWSRAVDRFVLLLAVFVIVVLPFPIEALLLGWRAVGETVWFTCALLLYHEFLFMRWDKLPFTCTYAPGKTPPLILLSGFIGIMALLPIVTALIVRGLYSPAVYVLELFVLVTAWNWLRRSRMWTPIEGRLRYEDALEPEVRGLGLGRE